MILLFNVKITQHGLTYYNRGTLPNHSRIDVFKYCLAGYAAMLPLISKCIFYLEIAPEFAGYQSQLEEYIRSLFPADKLDLRWYRCNYSRDWRALCQEHQFNDDDVIWIAGNDDHIFIDYNLDVVASAIKTLKEDPDPLSAVYYSHWPEQMRLSMYYNGQLTKDRNFIKFTWRTFDGIRIVKGERFKRCWAETEYYDAPLYRTDWLYHYGYQLTGPVYAPTRELVRHYDGYSHVGNLMDIAPPLMIPPGFFENDMKIRIGYADRKEGWTNLNPAGRVLYAADLTGVDYRWTEEDIPLFWRSHISEIDIAPDYDKVAMDKARDDAFIVMTRVPMSCYQINFTYDGAVPVEWLSNHLRSDVKN